MIDVIILGNGNVATQLQIAFLKSKECNLKQVYSRSTPISSKLKSKVEFTQKIKEIKDADVYIISISDDSIRAFSKQLQFENKLVVHTSGSVSIHDLLCNANTGVFYPLQTISKQKKISFKNIPICLEAKRQKDIDLLVKVAKSISNKVYLINSKQRKSLHIAAVFVNNFTNHLYQIGSDICEENQVDFEILKPLIKETARKIEKLSPREAQTGPAKRNDMQTINKHLSQITANQQEIYTLLTNSIKSQQY